MLVIQIVKGTKVRKELIATIFFVGYPEAYENIGRFKNI